MQIRATQSAPRLGKYTVRAYPSEHSLESPVKVSRCKFAKLLCLVAAAVVCLLAVTEGRPSVDAAEISRLRRSPGGCRPKDNSRRLTERSLCPFTTRIGRVFAEYDIEVEHAELDPECRDSDLSCGEHGTGQCTPVKSLIQFGELSETVTLAYVCALPEGSLRAAQAPDLA
ncbi:hypothetical protein FJT64_016319 [Amphibalanus amphitrite]|uniref:Uncharacterized protein n=1 Tax=Amphibalanus amphitrite TaxID=1232801 RepID=A0A6A4X1F4_AMPAM|nr:hypothetical protein FJT64_016319 [Amphibalanus amphitrite]